MATKQPKPKKMGAPTKYKPEYCQAIIDWFNVSPTEESPVTVTLKSGVVINKTERRGSIPRFLEGFAHSINVDSSQLVRWASRYPEFRAAYTRAKELQKQQINTCGALGLYNPMYTKFMASNITDMRDTGPEAAQAQSLADIAAIMRGKHRSSQGVSQLKEEPKPAETEPKP